MVYYLHTVSVHPLVYVKLPLDDLQYPQTVCYENSYLNRAWWHTPVSPDAEVAEAREPSV